MRLALDRIHVLLHELADAVEEGGDAVGRGEIHGAAAYRLHSEFDIWIHAA